MKYSKPLVNIKHGNLATSASEALHPMLWRGLVGGPCPVVLGAGGHFCPKPRSWRPSIGNPTEINWYQSPLGWAFGSQTVSQPFLFWSGTGSGIGWKVSPPLTYFTYLRWTGTNDHFVWCTDARTTAIPETNGRYRGMMLYLSSGSRDVALVAADDTSSAGVGGAGTASAGTTGSTFPVDQWLTVAIACTGQPVSSSNTRIWVDGVEDTTVGTGGFGVTAVHAAAAQTLYNATRTTGLQAAAGLNLGMFLCWNRVLLDSEIAILHRDPTAPFRRRRVFVGKPRTTRRVLIGGKLLTVSA